MSLFDPAFEEWLDKLGDVRFRGRRARLELSIDRGDAVYYFETLPDGWIRVTHRLRDGAAYWDLDAATLGGAEAYVSVKYANTVRGITGAQARSARKGRPGV